MAETEQAFIARKAHDERKAIEKAGGNAPSQREVEKKWREAGERAEREKNQTKR